jgi:hypothetical protein
MRDFILGMTLGLGIFNFAVLVMEHRSHEKEECYEAEDEYFPESSESHRATVDWVSPNHH